MFVLHSIRNLIRSWKKSVLFYILLTALVVILCVSMGMTVMIQSFLKDCDNNYTTIAVFEYMGVEYPNEAVYDAGISECFDAFDFSSLAFDPYVKYWEENQSALGFIEGRTDVNTLASKKNGGVVLVYIYGYYEAGGVYISTIVEAPYSYRDTVGCRYYINTDGTVLELGHYYMIAGEFYNGQTSYTYFSAGDYSNTSAQQTGFEGRVSELILDVTAEDGGYLLPERDSYFYRIADSYRVINQHVSLRATLHPEALLPFQQGTLYLTEGTYFTGNKNANECLISEFLAASYGVSVGDTFNIAYAVGKGCTENESYWAGTGFGGDGDYLITGIFNTQQELKNNVYISLNEDLGFNKNRYSYTLGQATLKNNKAEEFLTEIEPLLPERVRVTIYDQGYSGTVQPFQDVLRITGIITAVCILIGLALALLFGYLFVFRQKESARIMHRLGVKQSGIFIYYLSGAALIELIAAVTGFLISLRCSELLVPLLEQYASNYSTAELRYSSGNLSMVKTIAFTAKPDSVVFLTAGAAVMAAAVLSCLFFTLLCLKGHQQRQRRTFRNGTRSRSLNGGVLKYAWLSVSRGAFRTVLPVLVCACAVLLLTQLSHTITEYREQMENLQKNTVIEGYFTDIGGQQLGGLSVESSVVQDLYSSGYLSEIRLSIDSHYKYYGVYDEAGELQIKDQLVIPPSNSFAYETLVNRILTGPNLICTNKLSTVQEFYYSPGVVTEYFPGYGPEIFTKEYSEEVPCMVSTAFLQDNGLKPGDTIAVLSYDDTWHSVYITELIIAGSFVKEGTTDNIYCPLGSYISPFFYIQEELSRAEARKSFSGASFQLTDSSVLSDFKEFLAERGYSEVSRIGILRNFITIEDKSYLSTMSAMTQRIWYMEHTFPVIYLLVELLAALVPCILLQLRRRELAIMRSQGASKRTAFFSLFTEQLMLAPVGAILGILLGGVPKNGGLWLVFAFVVFWLLGSALSLWKLNRSSVRSILKSE